MVRERHRVFVKSGVTAEVTEELLQRHFSSYGSVTDVYIPKVMPAQTPKGFAYISFDSEESVHRAVFFRHPALEQTFLVLFFVFRVRS